MSYWLEMQARERLADRLREAEEWRLNRTASKPTNTPTRPQRRSRIHLRRSR